MMYIKLSHGNEITITEAAYEQIKTIVERSRICRTCKMAYSYTNPMVSLNLCLSCFLQQESHRHLIYVGELSKDSTYGYSTHGFRDTAGYIHTSYTGSDRSLERSEYDTILLWGFKVPNVYETQQKEYRLYSYYWSIYGDFRHNSTIVIVYSESHGDQLHVAFLASKDGSVKEINKRTKAMRQLFAQARKRLEATKDVHGAYHLSDDWTTYEIRDVHLYSIISDMLSEEQSTPTA